MPEISRFYGIIISMYYDDHNPPHFHAKYGEYSAKIGVLDFAVEEGFLPPKALSLVIEWASINKESLLENWERARNFQELNRIKPLI